MRPYRTTVINIFISFLSSGCLATVSRKSTCICVLLFYYRLLTIMCWLVLICFKCIYMCCYAHFELANVENEKNDGDKQSAEVEE